MGNSDLPVAASRGIQVCGPSYPYDPEVRTIFSDDDARIYAWPSRGGVIILSPAEAIDFEHLGLDPLDPPLERDDDQATEDAFCQQLLLLGAKWWDSEIRFSVASAMEYSASGTRIDNAFKLEKQAPPTMREKRLVKVGWPSTGGVWVAEFDTTWAGVNEEENLLPYDVELGMLRMARSMDERCTLLRDRFDAIFFEDVSNYSGYAFLNSWEWKETGEVGPLLNPHETREAWVEAHYSTSS